MIPTAKAPLLEGKRGLIVGIANDQSIAWGCAKASHDAAKLITGETLYVDGGYQLENRHSARGREHRC
jgi:enoyl-[acyl-carrier-protein] reductase (NADH)